MHAVKALLLLPLPKEQAYGVWLDDAVENSGRLKIKAATVCWVEAGGKLAQPGVVLWATTCLPANSVWHMGGHAPIANWPRDGLRIYLYSAWLARLSTNCHCAASAVHPVGPIIYTVYAKCKKTQSRGACRFEFSALASSFPRAAPGSGEERLPTRIK